MLETVPRPATKTHARTARHYRIKRSDEVRFQEMTKTRFWTADVRWEDEPRPEELRRLHSLLASDPKLALQGLQELSEQGSLAATLYIAIHLDSSAVDEHDEEESVRWYEKAAKMGSRAARYQWGVKLSSRGKFFEAERAFKVGADENF